jgi:probable metal-binding protein
MKQEIHGHEVMAMMINSGKTYSREELVIDIIARFGADARFYTCSAQGLDATQLVSFLSEKGKFVERDSRLATSADLMCKH